MGDLLDDGGLTITRLCRTASARSRGLLRGFTRTWASCFSSTVPLAGRCQDLHRTRLVFRLCSVRAEKQPVASYRDALLIFGETGDR
jgi:hypothetical protein